MKWIKSFGMALSLWVGVVIAMVLSGMFLLWLFDYLWKLASSSVGEGLLSTLFLGFMGVGFLVVFIETVQDFHEYLSRSDRKKKELNP